MQRVQRKRTKGFKLPPNAKYVGRPTKYGNPFTMKNGLTRKEAIDRYRYMILSKPPKERIEFLRPLRGKDLACFCSLDQPCHADVLLQLLKDYEEMGLFRPPHKTEEEILKMLKKRIKEFLHATPSTWFDAMLTHEENPYYYSRTGIFDTDKARESKARRELSHTFMICSYCLKQKASRARICCSKECDENFHKEYRFWIKSWFGLRDEALTRDAFECRKCGEKATDVDHVIEISDGGEEWDLENLQSLCDKCHKEKTAQSRRARSKTKSLDSSLEEYLTN